MYYSIYKGEYLLLYIWALMLENLSSVFANSKSQDHPAHLHRLIRVLVNFFLDSIISRLATSEISIF